MLPATACMAWTIVSRVSPEFFTNIVSLFGNSSVDCSVRLDRIPLPAVQGKTPSSAELWTLLYARPNARLVIRVLQEHRVTIYIECRRNGQHGWSHTHV